MSKRMLLRFMVLLLVGVLVLGACAPAEEPVEVVEDAEPAEVMEEVEEADAGAEADVEEAAPLKIAMVTDLTGLSGSEENKGFNDLAWDGLLQAQEELGAEIILVESREQADYEPNMSKLAEEGYDLIIGVGFLLTDAINAVAERYPDTNFAIIDSVVDQPNVASYVFAENEGSFLVGAIAAGMTETGTIGFVGGMEVPLIQKFEAGYIAGAMSINPDVEILSGYTGTFGDPAKGKELALAQYSKDADVIYGPSGACVFGVIEAAAEEGFFAIGVDNDQDHLAPGNVLTSMLKHVGLASYDAIESVYDGTFAGGLVVLDLAADGVGYSPLTYTRDLIPEELLAEVEVLAAMIRDGSLVVPDTLEALADFTPPTME